MIDEIIGFVFDGFFADPPKFISRHLKPRSWTKALVIVLWNLLLLLAVLVAAYFIAVKL